MEGLIIAALITLAALFLTVRLVKTFRGKVPPCCSGSAKDRKDKG
jgi:hypothetical protein